MMNLGNRRDYLFLTDKDRQFFLDGLADRLEKEANTVMTINNDKQAIPAKLSIFRFLFSFLGIDLFGRKALNTKIIPGKFNKSRNTGPMNNMLVMKSTETKINDQTGLYTLHNFVDVVAV